MSTKYGTFSGKLLRAVGEATGFFTWPPETSPYTSYKYLKGLSKKKIYDDIYRLKKQGLLRVRTEHGKKFIELTKKGELEILLIKAREDMQVSDWDGKWRLAIFDIPEDARDRRDKLRHLLKQNGFVKWQASVFISPYALNRSAIDYLKQTSLMGFIHFARIDELDDDKELKKKFKL